jgi:pantoate kinase
MRAKAFAPGHVTGFFEILDGRKDPLRRGSCGAGVNLSLGVLSSVEVRKAARQSIDIRINGKDCDAATTLRAVRCLLGRSMMAVDVDSRSALPVGQGFGMSAAGALSASLALGTLLHLTHLQAGRAAHIAEIEERTGLGDVAAQLRGGWEIRLRAGYPPHGLVDRFLAPQQKIALCVCGDPVPTKTVLTDPVKRRMICRAGHEAMRRMQMMPTLEEFFSLSHDFAQKTGLAADRPLSLADDIINTELGLASVSMIGNSVFAVGRVPEIARLMKGRGKVFVCDTDWCGAGPVS